ncbi:carbon storage regulator [Calycomorphotria hydatis]|uniref:Carbon storage regulator n=1 Tax=Calycomorphotria hydatis TaxID=2528027 RepID=A0A517T6N1_9PLAN|nr:carbon storage regulator [Calycomorphotria hydatis]QDT64035.1 Carbon storage regulator [Calycomorphotria hydatis]
MQVISCRVHEELVIDGGIRIKILEINEEGVLVGVTIPGEEPAYEEYVLEPQALELAVAGH